MLDRPHDFFLNSFFQRTYHYGNKFVNTMKTPLNLPLYANLVPDLNPDDDDLPFSAYAMHLFLAFGYVTIMTIAAYALVACSLSLFVKGIVLLDHTSSAAGVLFGMTLAVVGDFAVAISITAALISTVYSAAVLCLSAVAACIGLTDLANYALDFCRGDTLSFSRE